MRMMAALAMLLSLGSLLVGCGGEREVPPAEVKTAEATPAEPIVVDEIEETVEAPPEPVAEETADDESAEHSEAVEKAAEEALEDEGPPPAPRPSLLLRMLPQPIDNAVNANVQSLQETVGSVVPMPNL